MKSVLLTPQVPGVYAVLLFETFREISRGAKPYIVGYLLDGLCGRHQQGSGMLQAHLPQHLYRRESGQSLHFSIELHSPQSNLIGQIIHLQ